MGGGEGGQIHFTCETKYSGTLHMFAFCFIELELKLCILHFESQFKQTENCANFHLVKPEGGSKCTKLFINHFCLLYWWGVGCEYSQSCKSIIV